MQTILPFPQARNPARAQRPSRRWRRWLLVPLILALIASGALWWRSSQQTTAVAITTATVGQGDLAITVSGSGAVAAARTVDVPFQQAGTITAVDVAVGEQVSAGQTLATIDVADLTLALQQAQANLTAALASYEQVKSGTTTPQDLASAQASLDSATAQLQQTITGSATKVDIQSATAQLGAAQAQLDALKNPTAADRSAAQRAIDQAQIALQSTRDSASQAKTNAQLAMEDAVNALTQAQSKYALAQSNWQHVQAEGTDPTNPTTTDASGSKKKNKLNDAERAVYYDAFIQAQAALASAENNVTQAQVSYDTARQSEVTQVAQAEAAVQDAQAQLDALLNPSASDLAQARAAVTQAQASLTNLKTGGTAADVAQAQASVAQAQANVDSLTAPASDADLASAAAAVTQAQVAVESAQASFDQATLTAPFAGVVSAVGIVPDSTISAGTTAVTLVDQSKLHVDVNLSESDAAKVAVGQPVTLTFDALPDVILTGTVATIAPSATTSQNVVTYPVQIEFDPGTTAVKVGMSATADIQVEQATGALLVPSRAIQTTGDAKSVTLQQGDATTTVPVTTGLISDGQTVIVSSGGNGAPALKAGDVVVVPGTAASTTSSASSTQRASSSLSGRSAGGPPGGP
jgi:HlyD family secretion protein